MSIIELYVNVLMDYFKLMDQSDVIRKLENVNYITYVGLSVIINVFKINLINTRNIDIVFYHMQKAYYCYLEYIEQIYKNTIIHNLNITDVVTFIYKKTIEDHPTDNFPANTHDSLEDEADIYNNLQQIEKITNILMFWNNNDFTARIRGVICQQFLLKYLDLFQLSDVYPLIEYFEIIIEKITITEESYITFLTEFYKKVMKLKKNNKIPLKYQLDMNILVLCNQSFPFEKDLSKVNMSDFMNELF